MNDKIYIVGVNDYEGYDIHGAFLNKSKAKEYVDTNKGEDILTLEILDNKKIISANILTCTYYLKKGISSIEFERCNHYIEGNEPWSKQLEGEWGHEFINDNLYGHQEYVPIGVTLTYPLLIKGSENISKKEFEKILTPVLNNITNEIFNINQTEKDECTNNHKRYDYLCNSIKLIDDVIEQYIKDTPHLLTTWTI